MTYIELRLGRPPFVTANSDMWQIMRCHLTEQPDLATLEEAEQKAILKAVAKDPDQRYPSCRAFAEALSRAVQPQTEPPPPQTLGWRWLLVVMPLLVLLAFVIYHIFSPH
jgi:hypothetical protein